MKRPGYESDRYRVVVFDRVAGTLRTLTEDWDRSPASLAWSRAGDRLFATADDLGHHGVFAIDVQGGQVSALLGAGHAGAVLETTRGLVVLLDSLTSAADLWSVSAGGGAPRRLTDINADVMAHVRLGGAEPFTFTGAKGDTVHAWTVKPIDFDAGKKYPLAFLVHGGPQGSFGDGWSYRWNPQTYAAAGYAVVMVDFHGSTGYGQAFTDAINGDWGGAPYEDLMKGLDAALVKYPWIDGGRACALGASYGGWMVDYLAGKTDRFKCLVTHDGILSNPMNYYGTEELWFPEWELGGTPWDKPEGYAKYDPMSLVGQWKTPTLVIHGAKDYRVPDIQGLAVFTALQRRGIPSKLLYFPDENHWVLKPADSVLWHETVLAWLDQYIGATSQAVAPAK
jgi:dipeptidyl aminopeptidase/acylaminoacyl peptidase